MNLSDRWRGTLTRHRLRRIVLTVLTLTLAATLTGGFEPTRTGWATALVPLVRPGRDMSTPNPVEPPTRVRIPSIQVDSPLETLDLDGGGVLRAPRDFARAGWYAAGTAPGDVGPAVIAGHVDSRDGPAVFFRLHQLRAGDPIQVARGDRWLTFRVVTTDRYPKDRFPTADVYGPTPDAQLRLITCGGDFNRSRRSYADNVVVYAVAD